MNKISPKLRHKQHTEEALVIIIIVGAEEDIEDHTKETLVEIPAEEVYEEEKPGLIKPVIVAANKVTSCYNVQGFYEVNSS